MSAPTLTVEAIEAALTTRWLGRPAYVFDAIGSTNVWLAEQAQAGASEGTLAVADVQTAGKGRLGRTWQAPPGTGLLFSLLLRPPASLQAGQVAMAVSAGVAAGLAEHLGVPARLKWPNDVLLNGRKLAGVLGEASLLGGQAQYVIVGCGLNANLEPQDFPPPPPGGTPATSLLAELGRPVDRVALLQALLAAIEPRYEALRAGGSPQAEWRQLCVTLGQPVRVSGATPGVEGVAEDIAPDGSLLVRQADGRVVTVAAGDVSLRD